ncbi:MAG: hypothetical protein WC409_00930 [Candidatus Omnitrophota bacterium]|nr:hypothetical protein [Candidatus Omnitrophota bacterium]MDD5538614.1 hypothetical protein [Candidatus Omnitrophota bacterium]
MKRYVPRVLAVMFLVWNMVTPFAEAAKFGGASTDYITQDEISKAPIKAPAATTTPIPAPAPAAASNPWQTPKTPAVIAPAALPTSDLGAPVGPAAMPEMKNLVDIKPPDITVPNYEARYKAMLNAKVKAVAERKKHMKLVDRILEEVANYGIWIMLGLIAFVLIYTIYKEKETEHKIAAGQEQLEQKQMGEKKDIWQDEF